jgi:hypothetical protein
MKDLCNIYNSLLCWNKRGHEGGNQKMEKEAENAKWKFNIQ